MTRDGWLVVAVLVGLSLGVVSWWRWPSSGAALSCDAGEIFLDGAGVARCQPGSPLSAGQALTVGQKVPFERLSADDLSVLPGVGPQLAAQLLAEQRARGRFCSWEEIDALPGVGPARLEALRQLAEIGPCDSGL